MASDQRLWASTASRTRLMEEGSGGATGCELSSSASFTETLSTNTRRCGSHGFARMRAGTRRRPHRRSGCSTVTGPTFWRSLRPSDRPFDHLERQEGDAAVPGRSPRGIVGKVARPRRAEAARYPRAAIDHRRTLYRHFFQVDCARYRRAGQAVWKRAIIGRWETSTSPQPRTTSSPPTTRADSSTNSEQSREIVSYWMSWQREPPVPCWTSAAGLATSGLAFDRPVDMSSPLTSVAPWQRQPGGALTARSSLT